MVSEQTSQMLLRPAQSGLNPCFNGIWSRTGVCEHESRRLYRVLILVLMEYGLGRCTVVINTDEVNKGLNPCFNGIWSRTPQYANNEGILES